MCILFNVKAWYLNTLQAYTLKKGRSRIILRVSVHAIQVLLWLDLPVEYLKCLIVRPTLFRVFKVSYSKTSSIRLFKIYYVK